MVPAPAKKKRNKNNKQRQGSGDYDVSPRQACRFIATNGDGYRADTNIQIHKYTNTNRRLSRYSETVKQNLQSHMNLKVDTFSIFAFLCIKRDNTKQST